MLPLDIKSERYSFRLTAFLMIRNLDYFSRHINQFLINIRNVFSVVEHWETFFAMIYSHIKMSSSLSIQF